MFRSRSSSVRPSVLTPTIILLLLLVSLPATTLADPNAPSPGGATFPVIAQGVSPIQGDQIAWRVVADTAQTVGNAESLERALGFVIATQDAVLITDQDTGVQQRLAAGEAAFVPEAAIQTHESLGPKPTPYYRIALVPPDSADFTAGGDLVLAGDAFPSPAGDRDLDLILGDIPHGETERLPDYGLPTVILALTDGLAISPAEGGGAPEVLNEGQATVISGSRELRAASSGAAIFVAAVIGPDITGEDNSGGIQSSSNTTGGSDDGDDTDDDTDDDSATAAGRIAVWVYNCPADVSFQELTVPYPSDLCEVDYDATFVSLLNDDLPGGQYTLGNLQPDEGDLIWLVPYGEYTLATDNADHVVVEPADVVGDITGNTAVLRPLTIDESNPSIAIGVYHFESES